MAKDKENQLTVDSITVEVFTGDHKLTVEKAKEVLGWVTEADVAKAGVKFESQYLLKDLEGNKVRCQNNITNRPFNRGLSDSYGLEYLRNEWHGLNGETYIFDSKGHLQSGQHRLIGLVLAEQRRQQDKEKWKAYGVNGPLKIDAIFVTGISTKREVGDSIDRGRPRSHSDVLFRSNQFGDGYTPKQLVTLHRILAGAARLSWIRQGGKVVSDAPKLPHSELLKHYEANPGLKDAVEYIWREDAGAEGESSRIGSLISLPYAAGLLYLMSTAKSKNGEVDLSMKAKAEEFWTLFASGAGLEANNPILVLRKLLGAAEASSGAGRDAITILAVKAWNSWIDGGKVTAAELKVKMAKDKTTGKMSIDEDPRIGGLDVVVEKPKVELPEPVAKPAAAKVAKPVPVAKVAKPVPVAKAAAPAPKPRGAAAIKTVEGAATEVFSFE